MLKGIESEVAGSTQERAAGAASLWPSLAARPALREPSQLCRGERGGSKDCDLEGSHSVVALRPELSNRSFHVKTCWKTCYKTY